MSARTDTVDVAVIGAGPAGSTLAALLAPRGVSVALVDRDVFPRDKLCGEFLSYDALPVLDWLGVGAELERRGAPHIEHCRIFGRRRSLEFPLPHPARGVSRLLLDDLLLRTAARAGALLFDGWTADQLDGASLHLSREEEERTLTPRVIVGAWGRWGRFDTQLGRAFVRDREHRSFGFKRHYFALERDASASTIDLYSFGNGYLGVNAVENDITNICGLVDAQRLVGHRGRWESFVEMLSSDEPRLQTLFSGHAPAQEDFLSSEPVVFRARSAVERGVFMVGDASGIIDPLAGNGMAMGIQSALLLAPLVLRLLANPETRTATEREYAERHAAMFLPRIGWSRRVAFLLSRPALLDAALTAVRTRSAGEFLVRRTRAAREEVQRLADQFFRA